MQKMQLLAQRDWRCDGLVIAVGITSLLTNFLTPTIVGIFVDSYGLTLKDAGYMAAVYMAGGGLGGALVSVVLLSFRTRLLLTFGLVALSVGSFGAIFAHSLAAIIASRLLAGLGEGVGFALMGAGVSRMADPNRVFGIFTLLMLLIAGCCQYVVPWVQLAVGARMLFVPLGVAPALLLLFVYQFPDLTAVKKSKTLRDSGDASLWFAPYFWSGILAVLLLYIAYGAGFAYMDRIGVRTGISSDAVASILGTGYLVSAGGAIAMIATANRGSRRWKLYLSLIVVVLATLATVIGDPLTYRLGVITLDLSWFYFVPNLLAILASADATGRLTAAAMGAMEWGIAIGPAVAAFLLGETHFIVIAVIAACGFLSGLVLLVPVIRRVNA